MPVIETICICGAGTMGAGIAQVAAQAGFYTILYDVNSTAIGKAQDSVNAGLQVLLSKNKITAQEAAAVPGRMRFTSDINDCIADFFIEAVAENLRIKTGLFNQLHEYNHSEVIFATNTSSLSIDAIAAQVMHPQRLAGMHFFNPAPVMKLVEVVRGQQTSDDTLEAVLSVAGRMHKTAVLCKDAPGFIVNRVARPYYLESLRMAEQGLLEPAAIDRLMEATGFRMGPFALMDLIGNDVNLAVSRFIYDALGQPPRLQPSALQQQKVEHGELGRKTGKGYFNYP